MYQETVVVTTKESSQKNASKFTTLIQKSDAVKQKQQIPVAESSFIKKQETEISLLGENASLSKDGEEKKSATKLDNRRRSSLITELGQKTKKVLRIKQTSPVNSHEEEDDEPVTAAVTTKPLSDTSTWRRDNANNGNTLLERQKISLTRERKAARTMGMIMGMRKNAFKVKAHFASSHVFFHSS